MRSQKAGTSNLDFYQYCSITLQPYQSFHENRTEIDTTTGSLMLLNKNSTDLPCSQIKSHSFL